MNAVESKKIRLIFGTDHKFKHIASLSATQHNVINMF
jgi:hypothetical protein